MKRNNSLLFCLLFGLSVSLLLYPTVSELWNRARYSHLSHDYHTAAVRLSEDRTAALINSAVLYNEQLNSSNFMHPVINGTEPYDSILNLKKTGMIGTIEIEGLTDEIPFYHGTAENMLQKGVGHVEGTSFPVYGKSTHCVLAGHTGLRRARIFTDLSKVKIGDHFRICILGLRSDYAVDDIRTVLPENTQFLRLYEGEEYCSLVTCTPYGINSHRLVIRGKRIK